MYTTIVRMIFSESSSIFGNGKISQFLPSSMDAERQICTFAFLTRFMVIVLQFFSNLAIPDHEADAFNPPLSAEEISHFNWADWGIHISLGGLCRWDAVYFTHIMQYGYTFEHCAAFFPMYPLIGSILAALMVQCGVLHFSSCILLMSVTINLTLFVLTALSFYRLSKIVTGNQQVALYAALLFCINPASIFMTAPYSEITYMYLLTQALLKLHQGHKWVACFTLGLSAFTRSNGLVGAGFFLHAVACSFFSEFSALYKLQKASVFNCLKQNIGLSVRIVVITLIGLMLIIAPFFLYQHYIYMEFCLPAATSQFVPGHLISYGRLQGYHLLGDPPSAWCNNTIPVSYSYMQSHYWDVGFLSYYQFKQIPNFLLALPVIVLGLQSCHYFFRLNPWAFYTLGLFPESVPHGVFRKKNDDADDDSEEMSIAHTSSSEKRARRSISVSQIDGFVVYVYHLAFLIIFGCVFIHIQVLTRMVFSSSPLIFWYCAAHLLDTSSSASSTSTSKGSSVPLAQSQTLTASCLSWLSSATGLPAVADLIAQSYSSSSFILFYFVTYFVVGTVLFSNFLPWT